MEQRQDNAAARIKDDVLTMIGGHFTPASLGPAGYEEILARARARANEYLDVFESLFLGPNFDAVHQSNLHLPVLLKSLADAAPERVNALAKQLLKQYDAVLAFHDAVTDRAALFQLLSEDMVRLSQRLDSRRMELRQLMR